MTCMVPTLIRLINSQLALLQPPIYGTRENKEPCYCSAQIKDTHYSFGLLSSSYPKHASICNILYNKFVNQTIDYSYMDVL